MPVNFEIYENSRVTEIDFSNKKVFANDSCVEYEHIVVATHYPIFNFPEMMFAKMYQSTSYCQAYKNPTKLNGLYVEDIPNGLTFRNFNGTVIVGGFDHRTGRVGKINPNERLSRAAKTVVGKSELTNQWHAQDCMTFDYLPFAGEMGAKQDNCYVITGFNKWGMANAMVSAQLVCNLIQGEQNQFEQLFSLSRPSVITSPAKSAVHVGVTCKNLIKTALFLPFADYKNLKINHGGIFMVNGKKYGIFRDELGNFHKVQAHCSHLGCELTFNQHTKTFDCECHGSRFTPQGEILNEPATTKLKQK